MSPFSQFKTLCFYIVLVSNTVLMSGESHILREEQRDRVCKNFTVIKNHSQHLIPLALLAVAGMSAGAVTSREAIMLVQDKFPQHKEFITDQGVTVRTPPRTRIADTTTRRRKPRISLVLMGGVPTFVCYVWFKEKFQDYRYALAHDQAGRYNFY